MFEIIFSSYLYTEKYNFNLLKFKKHILQTMKEDKKGRVISNYGGWQSDSFVKVNSFNEGIFKKINESVVTYNFEVENTHTYFAENVIVHNSGGGPGGGSGKGRRQTGGTVEDTQQQTGGAG